MTEIRITSDHPDAEQLVRRALENYALVCESLAVSSRTRPLHPGETRERLERRAQVLDERNAALLSMSAQVGTTTGSDKP